MTKTEQKLWFHLRDRRLCGMKFRRQVPIEYYIVDFVCFEKRLIIEVDGGGHVKDNQKNYDEKRDEFLKSAGYKILRFWNNELENNFDDVMDLIYKSINPPHP